MKLKSISFIRLRDLEEWSRYDVEYQSGYEVILIQMKVGCRIHVQMCGTMFMHMWG